MYVISYGDLPAGECSEVRPSRHRYQNKPTRKHASGVIQQKWNKTATCISHVVGENARELACRGGMAIYIVYTYISADQSANAITTHEYDKPKSIGIRKKMKEKRKTKENKRRKQRTERKERDTSRCQELTENGIGHIEGSKCLKGTGGRTQQDEEVRATSRYLVTAMGRPTNVKTMMARPKLRSLGQDAPSSTLLYPPLPPSLFPYRPTPPCPLPPAA